MYCIYLRMGQDILFALMTEQEGVFFSEIACLLKKDAISCAFLTFHEASDTLLEKKGFPYFSLHKLCSKNNLNPEDSPSSMEKEFGIHHFRNMYWHEMLMTRRKNEEAHIKKALRYLRWMDEFLARNSFKCVIQELGGFIAPQSLFFATQKRKISHFFIEPSVFPKRVVFTLNSLHAKLPPETSSSQVPMPPELKSYFQGYFEKHPVVIPLKDRMSFKDMTLSRLFSSYNFRRLGKKFYHKYFAKKQEEYNALLSYVGIHVSRWLRRKVLSFFYQKPKEGEKYIYFPFHVPWDVQLTIRGPQYLNQEALVQHLAFSLPTGYKLYVKEHPAAIGAHSLLNFAGIFTLRNTRLIHPKYNSFDLISKAQAIVTINSKVGAETLLQGKPLLVLGKAFYRNQQMTVDVEHLEDLPQKIREVLSAIPNREKTEHFFLKVWNWSFPGELFDMKEENIAKFSTSIKKVVTKDRTLYSMDRGKDPITTFVHLPQTQKEFELRSP